MQQFCCSLLNHIVNGIAAAIAAGQKLYFSAKFAGIIAAILNFQKGTGSCRNDHGRNEFSSLPQPAGYKPVLSGSL